MVKVGEKRRREVPVVLPGRIEVPPDMEEREEEVQRKEERRGVIRVARGVGAVLSGLTITVGLLLMIISSYLLYTRLVVDLTDQMFFFNLVLLFLGILNTTSGLLLIGRGEVEEK